MKSFHAYNYTTEEWVFKISIPGKDLMLKHERAAQPLADELLAAAKKYLEEREKAKADVLAGGL